MVKNTNAIIILGNNVPQGAKEGIGERYEDVRILPAGVQPSKFLLTDAIQGLLKTSTRVTRLVHHGVCSGALVIGKTEAEADSAVSTCNSLILTCSAQERRDELDTLPARVARIEAWLNENSHMVPSSTPWPVE